MIRLHFEDDKLGELITFLESKENQLSSIAGLLSTDLVTTGSGEAMIIATWKSATSYESSSEEMDMLLEEMRPLLTSTPHGHEGAVVYSSRN